VATRLTTAQQPITLAAHLAGRPPSTIQTTRPLHYILLRVRSCYRLTCQAAQFPAGECRLLCRRHSRWRWLLSLLLLLFGADAAFDCERRPEIISSAFIMVVVVFAARGAARAPSRHRRDPSRTPLASRCGQVRPIVSRRPSLGCSGPLPAKNGGQITRPNIRPSKQDYYDKIITAHCRGSIGVVLCDGGGRVWRRAAFAVPPLLPLPPHCVGLTNRPAGRQPPSSSLLRLTAARPSRTRPGLAGVQRRAALSPCSSAGQDEALLAGQARSLATKWACKLSHQRRPAFVPSARLASCPAGQPHPPPAPPQVIGQRPAAALFWSCEQLQPVGLVCAPFDRSDGALLCRLGRRRLVGSARRLLWPPLSSEGRRQAAPAARLESFGLPTFAGPARRRPARLFLQALVVTDRRGQARRVRMSQPAAA
jgi:hypothetical protein